MVLQRGGGIREAANGTRDPTGHDHRGDQAHGEHAGGHQGRQPQVSSNRLQEALRRQMHDGRGDGPIAAFARDRGHDLQYRAIQVASGLSVADHAAELDLVILAELRRHGLARHRAVDERHDRPVHDAHGNDVATGHQVLDQAMESDLVAEMLEELGVVADLHDPLFD